MSQFQLFIEKSSLSTTEKQAESTKTIAYLSLSVQFAQLAMHYPPIILNGKLNIEKTGLFTKQV